MVRRAIVGAFVALGLEVLGACVLADPPADLPVLPVEPPEVERASVTPPVASLLVTWPANPVVPVLVDSTATGIDWQVVIDHGSPTPPTHYGFPADQGVQTPPVSVPYPTYPQECHTIEVFVYYDTDTSEEDSVAWFYSPTGSFQGCPIFDAGVDAADAADDVAEGGE